MPLTRLRVSVFAVFRLTDLPTSQWHNLPPTSHPRAQPCAPPPLPPCNRQGGTDLSYTRATASPSSDFGAPSVNHNLRLICHTRAQPRAPPLLPPCNRPPTAHDGFMIATPHHLAAPPNKLNNPNNPNAPNEPAAQATAIPPSPVPTGEVAESPRPEGAPPHASVSPNPCDTSNPVPDSPSILPGTDERHLLGTILGSHRDLGDIAAQFNTTILAIAEWMETPHIQAQLALIERVATTRARVQAAELRTAAVETLNNILNASRLNTDRDRSTAQRAVTALLLAVCFARPTAPTPIPDKGVAGDPSPA